MLFFIDCEKSGQHPIQSSSTPVNTDYSESSCNSGMPALTPIGRRAGIASLGAPPADVDWARASVFGPTAFFASLLATAAPPISFGGSWVFSLRVPRLREEG